MIRSVDKDPEHHGEVLEHAASRQRRVLAILACPTCHGRLDLAISLAADGYVHDADLVCAECGDVGVVSDGRPSFLDRERFSPEVPRGLVSIPIMDLAAECRFWGEWGPSPRGVLGRAVGAAIAGTVHGVGVAFEVVRQPRAGRVVLRCGEEIRVVDLYSPEPARVLLVVDTGQDGEHEWSATSVAGGDPNRLGDDLVVHEVRALVPASRAPCPTVQPVNRGNRYPTRFDPILAGMPEARVVVDLGGGDRRHPDRRVLNMEYLPYSAVDFRGDGQHLPVASDSVDLILSQAVLEHVPDPFGQVAEMRRILKPGGRIYADFAFMQPLHAVPSHYFNITPHGADLLFQDFDVIERGWFGGLEDTMEWFFRLLDADARIGASTTAQVLEALRRLDVAMSERDLSLVASGVFVEARKPQP